MHRKIEQVRQQKLANFCQVLLIDSSGMVIESCDSIFDTSNLIKKPVYEWFPFIESVFPSLSSLALGEPELLFSKVEKPAPYLQGYYDFSFSKAEVEEQVYFLWEVFDYSPLYRDFRKYQQRRNNLEIQRQIFSLENKNLKYKEEISNRQIGNQQDMEHSNPTSFNKNNLTAKNALDMTFEALQSFKNKDSKNNYLDSLDNISANLKKVVDELPEKEIDLTIRQSGHEREFSLENLLYDSIPYISSENINVNVMEASVAEELPNTLFGNPLDFKRILVGLALNTSKFYKDCVLKLELYLHDIVGSKCIVGVRITCIEGQEIKPDMMDVLLRLAIIKRIVELHQGELEMDQGAEGFGSKMICHIPFLMPHN